MKTKLILHRLEFNILPVNNMISKAARLYYNKKNEKLLLKIINKINNDYGILKIKEFYSNIEKNEFGHPTIVQIGNENSNIKFSSNVLNIKNLILTNNEKELIAYVEIQSLIFKVYQSNFDKYISFKFKRNWENYQGKIQSNCKKLFNLIAKELNNNNLIINAEIQKDNKKGYYLIKKIFI